MKPLSISWKQDEEGIKIWDPCRKKYLFATDEEKVRQGFICFLVNEMKYPLSYIKTEQGLFWNGVRQRIDILVYGKNTLPFLLVECKAPEVQINQNVIDQGAVYNLQLAAPYLVYTNLNQTLCFDLLTNPLRTLTQLPCWS